MLHIAARGLRGGAKRSLAAPFSALVSLEEEMTGVPALKPKTVTPSITVSKLSNGIPVVTRVTAGPSASVALLLRSGSRDEPKGSGAGATLLLQNMAYKTTEQSSTLFLNRTLELAACYASCSGGREATVFAAECAPGKAAVAMDAIAQAVLSPRMRPWEVTDVSNKVGSVDLRLAATDASLLLDEALHAAAFGEDSPLGHPYYSACSLDAPALLSLAKERTVAGKMVLAGAGMTHEQLLDLGERYFAKAPAVTASATRAKSPFVGGEARVKASSALTHVAVAFTAPAAAEAEAAAAAVLKAVLQARLAAAAPGSVAVSATYSDAGLLGAAGAAPSEQVPQLVDALCKAVKSLAAEITSSELSAAKAAVRIAALQALEKPGTAAAALAVAVAAGADPKLADGNAAAAVSAASCKALAAKMFKSKVAVACVGDVLTVPHLDAIAAKF